MIYSIGLSIEQLGIVGLEADKITEGKELVFNEENSSLTNTWLTTFNSLDSYEGYEELNKEEITLLPGDTVILSWWVALATLEQLRRKRIKVMVVEEEDHQVVGLLTYATY